MRALGWLLCFWGAESRKSDLWIVKSVIGPHLRRFVCLLFACVCILSYISKGQFQIRQKDLDGDDGMDKLLHTKTLSTLLGQGYESWKIQSKTEIPSTQKVKAIKHNMKDRQRLDQPTLLTINTFSFTFSVLTRVYKTDWSAKKCYQTTLLLENKFTDMHRSHICALFQNHFYLLNHSRYGIFVALVYPFLSLIAASSFEVR